jgi:hypothetical protein
LPTTPTETAAIGLLSGHPRSTRRPSMCIKRSCNATYAPLIEHVRVPPSA